MICEMTMVSDSYSNKWWVLFGLGLSIVILNLDLTIVNLALPSLPACSTSALLIYSGSTTASCLLTLASLFLGGYWADRYGRKKIYQWGIFIFAIGSLIAGIAINSATLIIGRTLQGLGIGISFQLGLILIGESFPENRRGMAIGLLSTFAGITQALGPTLGGVIVQWLGWRWAFINFTDLSCRHADHLVEKMSRRNRTIKPSSAITHSLIGHFIIRSGGDYRRTESNAYLGSVFIKIHIDFDRWVGIRRADYLDAVPDSKSAHRLIFI